MSAVISFSGAIRADTLGDLLKARVEAKRAEDAAAEARRAIDAKIVERLRDGSKTEGTVSEKAGDLKVSVTFGITRKVDADLLKADWEKLSPAAQAAFRWKAEVDTKLFRALESKDLKAIAKIVEAKPSSPSIKVELA